MTNDCSLPYDLEWAIAPCGGVPERTIKLLVDVEHISVISVEQSEPNVPHAEYTAGIEDLEVAVEATPPEEKSSGCSGCKSKGLKRLIAGGAKLLKSELGVDAADADTISRRRALCEVCPAYDFGVCNDCGCFLAAKVKLKSEVCPKKRW